MTTISITPTPIIPGLVGDITSNILLFCKGTSILSFKGVNVNFYNFLSEGFFEERFKIEHLSLSRQILPEAICKNLKSFYPSKFWRILCIVSELPIERFPLNFTAKFIEEGKSLFPREKIVEGSVLTIEQDHANTELDHANPKFSTWKNSAFSENREEIEYKAKRNSFEPELAKNLNEEFLKLKTLDNELESKSHLKNRLLKCLDLIKKNADFPQAKVSENLNNIRDLINSLNTEIPHPSNENYTIWTKLYDECHTHPSQNASQEAKESWAESNFGNYLPQLQKIIISEMMSINAQIRKKINQMQNTQN